MKFFTSLFLALVLCLQLQWTRSAVVNEPDEAQMHHRMLPSNRKRSAPSLESDKAQKQKKDAIDSNGKQAIEILRLKHSDWRWLNYVILRKEGRVLKPHKPGLDQKTTFIYETVGEQDQESFHFKVPAYDLPGFETGGPGIAPVATVEKDALAILTDKITGEYAYIPRTNTGEQRQQKKNPGYARLIHKLQDQEINVEDSVMAFVPNWIEPKHIYILYQKDSYNKCRRYDCENGRYPSKFVSTDCTRRGIEAGLFPIQKKGLSVQNSQEIVSHRQEIAAAVSEEQAFFYNRITSRPVSFVIQSTVEDEPWKKVLQNYNQDTQLSNVYVEKRNEDIDVLITEIMPITQGENRGRIEVYLQNCLVPSSGIPYKSSFQKLQDQHFNFPLTHYSAVLPSDSSICKFKTNLENTYFITNQTS